MTKLGGAAVVITGADFNSLIVDVVVVAAAVVVGVA